MTHEFHVIAALGQEAPGSEPHRSKKPVYFEWAKKIWESEETFKLPDGTHWPYVSKLMHEATQCLTDIVTVEQIVGHELKSRFACL